MKGTRAKRSHRTLRTAVPAIALALLASLGTAGNAPAADTPAFRNPKLSLNTRVDDLLARLTPDEKVSLLHQHQPAIPRLGIQSFRTGTEALHGVAWLGKATVFPQALGLASTWDPALIKQVGSAVGDETRGFQQERPDGWGLNVWAPVVNPLRDPRWGRNEEGYSEDPYLTGSIATAYGKGLTGDDPDHLKTAPTLKHYLANNNEVNRATSSSDLRPRVLHEYDEAAFKPAIAADAATGVMSSYNLVNGRPATVNPDLGDAVRSWTDRDLLNVTDAWAPNNLLPGGQGYYDTLAEADAATLKAGIDSFTTDGTDAAPTTTAVKSALGSGLLKQSDVDDAVRNILSIRFRLGEFDPDGGPYASIDKSVINSPAHQNLARKAAAEQMVLLKNENKALPLDASKTRNVAVVGPLSDTLYSDWYSGTLPYQVTPKQGIAARLGSGSTVTSSEGTDRIALKNTATGKYITAGDGTPIAESATTATANTQFDAFDWGAGVLTLRSVANGKYIGNTNGSFINDQDQPGGWFVQQQFKLEQQNDGSYVLRYAGYEAAYDWFGDKKYLGPGPDGTLTLVAEADAAHYAKDVVRSGVDEAVKAARAADTAIVVVGSMPAINGREDHDRTDMGLAEKQQELVRAVQAANPHTVVVVENSYPTTLNREQADVPAMLWTTHAGQETGNALADVLFGDVNPAGRLTQTWYRSEQDLPDILDYDIIKSDRTYLYYKGDPLYAFGHGLSYTSFRYGEPQAVRGGVRVEVTNTGKRAGDEVVQLYVHQRTSRDKQPVKQLKAYQRVSLKPGQTKSVMLPLKTADLAHWDVTRDRQVVESGTYDLMVGSASDDIRGRTSIHVRGESIPARNLSRTTRAANFDDYARGVRLVDESKARGDAALSTGSGNWLEYGDAQLGSGAAVFTAQVAREAAGSGTVEIRLGSPTGPLAGTAQVRSTGSKYTYTTVTAALSAAAKGRQDVYLVLSEGLRISTFSLR